MGSEGLREQRGGGGRRVAVLEAQGAEGGGGGDGGGPVAQHLGAAVGEEDEEAQMIGAGRLELTEGWGNCAEDSRKEVQGCAGTKRRSDRVGCEREDRKACAHRFPCVNPNKATPGLTFRLFPGFASSIESR